MVLSNKNGDVSNKNNVIMCGNNGIFGGVTFTVVCGRVFKIGWVGHKDLWIIVLVGVFVPVGWG